MRTSEKQAVVLIHGIGEQRPMENLRGFVRAVWEDDPDAIFEESRPHPPHAWSKPDLVSGSFELRRITTAKNTDGVRTDFFEFYWAHLMPGSTLGHIKAWLALLMFCWPTTVPVRLLWAWSLCWLLALVALLGAGHELFAGLAVADDNSDGGGINGWLVSAGSLTTLVTGLLSTRFIVDRVGDAARYLNASPPNIKNRTEIRTAGLELLERLHRRGADGTPEYGRIVVVGHSLGTVIGYDVLSLAWQRTARGLQETRESKGVIRAFNRAARATDPQEFRAAQARLLSKLQEHGVDWRVSDFVTLGSPLTYADYLLERGSTRFKAARDRREYPTCPPFLERTGIGYKTRRGPWTLHHAAPFAPTRWTNLYFRSTLEPLFGDFIGGPVAPMLGDGVCDCPLTPKKRHGPLAHTRYWAPGKDAPGHHIEMLRRAVSVAGSRAEAITYEPGVGLVHPPEPAEQTDDVGTGVDGP